MKKLEKNKNKNKKEIYYEYCITSPGMLVFWLYHVHAVPPGHSPAKPRPSVALVAYRNEREIGIVITP